ncbi:MAG TPA: tyrosine-type recombinase/integrase [Steroidobacteraceae bacterium]
MNSRLITQKSDVLALAEYLNDWSGMAQGAFSANTIRAWRADWEIFVESCRVYRLESLPASSKTVRAFVFECLGKGKKPATVRRYVSTIGRAHRASGVLDPTVSEDVRLALKEMGRNSTARQKQARGLVWAEIEAFLSIEPRNLRDIRDRALVAVAYDTMCRREELVSLLAEDISEASDGSASILIRRSKTDTTAEGAAAYLSPLTMRMLNQWITQAGIKKGAIFVRVHGAIGVGGPLTAQNVMTILRKVGQWIGLKREEWETISGHSARVGAAQDLLALNIDLSSVMQAGRWRDTRMPMRYGEKVLASRTGMARAAKSQGRA